MGCKPSKKSETDTEEEKEQDVKQNAKKGSGNKRSSRKSSAKKQKSKQAIELQRFIEEPDILAHFPDPSKVPVVDYIAKKCAEYIKVEDTFWSKKKSLIPDFSVIEKLDEHALKAPDSIRTSPEKLVSYLLKPCKTDVEKVRVLIRWIGNNIAYDVVGRDDPSKGDCSVEGVLRNRRAVCEGYANVVQKLCQLANIEAEKISGQCKNGTHPKQELRKVPKSDHAWNRVKISGSWYFVDSTWCAGSVGNNIFKKRWNEWWFLPDPEAYVYSHIPMSDDKTLLSEQQMVKKPQLDSEKWDTQIERTPAAYHFAIEPVTHQETRIKVEEDELVIKYRCKEGLEHFVNVYFLQNNTIQQLNDTSHVLYESEGAVHGHIRFKKAGVYFVNFVAEVKNGHDMIKHPITSLIYRITFAGKGANPFPQVLHSKLGLHPDFENSGFQLISPTSPVVATTNGCATITIKLPTKGVISNIASFYKSEANSSRELKGLVYCEKKGNMARYYIQCPERGEYKFGIFSKYKEGESLQLAMVFLITCQNAGNPVYYHPEDSIALAGPNAHFYQIGLTTDQNASTLKFVDDHVSLNIKKTIPASLMVELKSSCKVKSEELLKIDETDELLKVTVKKPNVPGYYWLTMYAKKGSKSGSYSHAGCFCIPYKVPAHMI